MYDKDFMDKHYLQSCTYAGEYNALHVVKTNGTEIYLAEGKKLLDLTGQLGAVVSGNGNSYINSAVKKTIDNIGFVWEESCIKEKEELIRFLLGNVFGRTSQINKIKFFVTGSEAVEASIEVAKNISKGSILLTNKYGFHGWTHFASACSDFPEFGRFVDEAGHYTRKKKENTRYFEYPTCSSCPYGKTKKRCVEEKELYCIKKIRDQIEEIGAKNIIAVCTDCMLGLAGIIPPPQYIPQLYKVLKEYGLIWIDDEIYSAFRLGKWFAYQEYSNVEPDIVCFGKSFSNGISPLSGIALSAKITSKLVNQKWQICSSFAANPVALTAALYNLKFIEDNRILEAVEEKGALLSMLLWHLKQRFPFIKEIRGKGLFWIIELEGEKNVNQYRHVSAKGEVSSFSLLRNQCIKNGVLIGSYLGNSIRISPALTITCEEIFNAYELLNISFEQYQNLARK